MHEASIAQAIVQSVLKNAQDKCAKSVQSVELEVGLLTFLNIEQVVFWVKIGFEETIAEQAEIRIHEVPARYKCRHCGHEGDVQIAESAITHFHTPVVCCSSCQCHEVDIVEGKDVVVRKIRIVQP